MTLVVGYALGPLPGFTVGALGMLASNVLLGQGPYTPWQMAAWGVVGLAGAALGRLSGRRLGRVGLALACALAALAAKEVMNVYTWTLGASHTPAAFLAVAVAALPFDLTDVGRELAVRPRLRPRAGEAARADARAHGRELGAAGASAASGAAGSPLAGRPAARPAAVAGAAGCRRRRCSPSARCSAGRAPRASRAAGAPERLARARLPRGRPERRRRLRRRARAVEQRALHGLGGDGAGRRRARPAERAPRRALGARRPARAKHRACRARATSSARSSRCAPAAPRCTRLPGGDPVARLLRLRDARRLLRRIWAT